MPAPVQPIDVQSAHPIIRSILNLAHTALEAVPAGGVPLYLGRIRGTGPGISFGSLVDQIEAAHPIEPEFPFEGSERVGGAVWDCKALLHDPTITAGIAKLQWLSGARELPMHVHPSDRFIVVLEGRGFFHWSTQSIEEFDGPASNLTVQTIAARSRDVFVFQRGLLHTFSTEDHPMTLLSVQLPFMAFDDPRQYRLPEHRWTAGEYPPDAPGITCLLHTPNAAIRFN